MIVDLTNVWRDKALLDDIRSEVKRQSTAGWRPWEILLPPELLWPMIEEVSAGMMSQWSPVVDNVGVQVGEEKEVAIRFVLKGLKTSPVMVRSIKYKAWNKDNVVPIEVHHGS